MNVLFDELFDWDCVFELLNLGMGEGICIVFLDFGIDIIYEVFKNVKIEIYCVVCKGVWGVSFCCIFSLGGDLVGYGMVCGGILYEFVLVVELFSV